MRFLCKFMEYFMPSEKIIKKIQGNFPLIKQYTSFPLKLNPRVAEETIRTFLTGIMHQVAEYYRWELDIGKNMDSQKLLVISEAINNGIIHGSKNKDFMDFGLFLGTKGVCYGFRDKGNYFKDEKIKEKWENKIALTEFGKGLEGFGNYGCKVGVNEIIYECSDIIEVDTEKGILYCVQFKKSLERKV